MIKSESLLVLHVIFESSPGNFKEHPRRRITDITHPHHSIAHGSPVIERTGIKTALISKSWAPFHSQVHKLSVPRTLCISSISHCSCQSLTRLPHCFVLPKFYPSSHMKPCIPAFLLGLVTCIICTSYLIS